MPKVISVTEAADSLGVNERTIRRWIKLGRMKGFRVLGDVHRFVAVDEVEALREPIAIEVRAPKPKMKARPQRKKMR